MEVVHILKKIFKKKKKPRNLWKNVDFNKYQVNQFALSLITII